MAVTKTHPIKSTLKAAIDYICNPAKTDGKLLVSSYGCAAETADIEFAWTRRHSIDKGTNLGRHLIQAFEPGEVSPEEAHEIGMQLAREVLGGKYEFVLTTHIDRDHVHNHLIFNAVSFADHRHYHSNKRSYHEIRRTSDRLCKEHGLSVVIPGQNKGKSYIEHTATQAGTSYKAMLKAAIDRLIPASADFEDLLRRLQQEGYEIKPNEVDALLEKEPSLIEIYQKCREEYGDALRMRGLSKELRYDLPMVSVALVIDSNAFPVDFMVFAGNKSEKTNMINSIDRLKSNYNITESIIVADSGLNSVPNMHMLLKNGFGYAISKSALSLPKKMEADITDLSKYTEKVDIHGNSLNYMYRIIDYPQKYKIIDDEHPDKEPVTIEIKNKMLLTFSKKRQQHDLAVLEEKFGKARKAVAERAKIKTANKGFSSFLSADIDTKKLVAKKIKMKLIEKHRKRAGFATVIYHDVPTKEEQSWLQSPKEETKPEQGIVGRKGLDDVDMSNVYHHLVQIERCFRIMKSNFSIRPMFVRTEAHINAHVLICIISLIMLRLLQKKLEENGIHLSENAICSGLNDARLSYTVRNNINVYEKLTIRRLDVSTTGKVNGYKMNVTDMLTEVIDGGKLNHYNSDEDLRKLFGVKNLELFTPNSSE